MSIDYTERIPNNVNLAEDRRLQRALESWQPAFLHWWGEMGPTLPTQDVYLRTAVAVGREGWANFARLTAWQNWIFTRPNAAGPDGALRRYGTGQRAVFDKKRA